MGSAERLELHGVSLAVENGMLRLDAQAAKRNLLLEATGRLGAVLGMPHKAFALKDDMLNDSRKLRIFVDVLQVAIGLMIDNKKDEEKEKDRKE